MLVLHDDSINKIELMSLLVLSNEIEYLRIINQSRFRRKPTVLVENENFVTNDIIWTFLFQIQKKNIIFAFWFTTSVTEFWCRCSCPSCGRGRRAEPPEVRVKFILASHFLDLAIILNVHASELEFVQFDETFQEQKSPKIPAFCKQF